MRHGKWSVRLPDLKAGTSGDMTVAGSNSIAVKDVIVGEVWVASGQSNMEFRVNGAMNHEAEIAAANNPAIRMFNLKAQRQSGAAARLRRQVGADDAADGRQLFRRSAISLRGISTRR